MNLDLSVPIWTIDHVAAALHLSVDTAREHTYTAGFPAPRGGFARHLWLREEVLAWFAALPARPAGTPRPTGTGTAASRALKAGNRATPAGSPTGGPITAPAGTRPAKPYRPRRRA
jgi:hypothetical protein